MSYNSMPYKNIKDIRIQLEHLGRIVKRTQEKEFEKGQAFKKFFPILFIPIFAINALRINWAFRANKELDYFRTKFHIKQWYVILYGLLWGAFWRFFTPLCIEFLQLISSLLELSKANSSNSVGSAWDLLVTYLQNQCNENTIALFFIFIFQFFGFVWFGQHIIEVMDDEDEINTARSSQYGLINNPLLHQEPDLAP